jgi:hypothetical protein
MESVIFWTTLSAFLGCRTHYIGSAPHTWIKILNDNGYKFSKMKESQEWFTIKLDNRAYPVFRALQPDESVIFIARIEDRKIKLHKGENDCWIGDAEQDLIDRIGKAIEEA